MPAGALLPIGWGTTVGTTSGPVMPSNPSRNGLIFINNSVSASIAICPAVVNVGALGIYAGAATGVAAINGVGSFTMQPGDKFIIDTTFICTSAWNGIASGPGAALTILE